MRSLEPASASDDLWIFDLRGLVDRMTTALLYAVRQRLAVDALELIVSLGMRGSEVDILSGVVPRYA